MPDELTALAEIAIDAAERVVLRPAQTLHQAVAARAFAANGPAAAPVRLVHDGVAQGVYAGVGAAMRAARRAAHRRVTRREEQAGRLSSNRRGRLVIGALNGIAGDRLIELESPLAAPMSLRSHGSDITCTSRALQAAFPHASTRIGVFVHGLCENEEAWHPLLLMRAATECGVTPVTIRYNTGLHIASNGARFAALLEQLCAEWPVSDPQLVLIGHSMGGLVIRGAAQLALERGLTWPMRTTHLVTLGTPHQGSYVEKGAHAAARMLRRVPEARAVADLIDMRSAGIRDLRHGYIHDDEWQRDVPAMPPAPIPSCAQTFIVARVTRSATHPMGRLVGDLLVRTDSAAGRHRRRHIPLPDDAVRELGGLHHLDLLGHPRVVDAVCAAVGPATRQITRAGSAGR